MGEVVSCRADEPPTPCTGGSFPSVIEFSSSFFERAKEIHGGVEFAYSDERFDRVDQKVVVDRKVPKVGCCG
jgi:hypothetical protein